MDYNDTQTYELADFSERAIGLVIDTILIGAVGGVFGVGANFLWGSGIVGLIIGGLYQWYFLTRQNGQTIGKMVMNTRVVKADGTLISDADAIVRYFGYYINTPLIFLGWLWALLDDSRQGFHDKIANTYVVKAS